MDTTLNELNSICMTVDVTVLPVASTARASMIPRKHA